VIYVLIAIAVLLVSLVSETNGVRKANERSAAVAEQAQQYYFMLYYDDLEVAMCRDWVALNAQLLTKQAALAVERAQ
jgi:hypothetical protein